MYAVDQWINWRPEQRPGKPKPDKVPCVVGGGRIDPHDPRAWMPYNLAQAMDAAHKGFVLTAADPYFCIDLDHAWNGAEWSPLALAVCAMFPDAYVEVSYSGDGLHIIGRGTVPAGYGTRGPGVECYTERRFIAITGAGVRGNPDAVCDLTVFATMYLKLSGADVAGIPWTDGPQDGARPVVDDDALISKMLSSRASASVAFGGKASVSDLWYARVEPLTDAYPSQTDQYDRSAADAALASHLAFWTGKDCERITRLMRRSALVRSKWDREDYLRRTVSGAVAQCGRVYTGPSPTQEVAAVQGDVEVRAGSQYMTVEQQSEWFKGCCYVISAHRVMTPAGVLLKPESFKAAYGGFQFQMDWMSDKPTKNAFEAFTESRVTRFPKAHGTCFRPEVKPGGMVTSNGLTLVNTYVPANVELGDGPVDPFLDLMSKLFPVESDRAIMLAYLAALRQYPGAKFRWCPLLQGVEGNIKGAITKIAEYCVGERYTHRANAKELGDSGAKFTGWIEGRLLVVIEEIYVSDRRDLLDTLKPLITDDRVEIQAKGVDQKTGENRANFILTSNHRDAVQKTLNDRRYAIFYTGQQTVDDLARDGMTGDYAPRLYNWLNNGGYADVAGYLQRYAIPDALNPATNCHRAPETSSTAEAIAESRGVVEQEIMAAVDEGRQGFAGGWISSVALGRLLVELRRTVGPRKRGSMIASLGYVPHPALPNGQSSTALFQEDGKRPYLYVKRDSIPALNISDPGEVVAAYIKAQGYGALATLTPTNPKP